MRPLLPLGRCAWDSCNQKQLKVLGGISQVNAVSGAAFRSSKVTENFTVTENCFPQDPAWEDRALPPHPVYRPAQQSGEGPHGEHAPLCTSWPEVWLPPQSCPDGSCVLSLGMGVLCVCSWPAAASFRAILSSSPCALTSVGLQKDGREHLGSSEERQVCGWATEGSGQHPQSTCVILITAWFGKRPAVQRAVVHRNRPVYRQLAFSQAAFCL